jgi:hypothetical protein
MRRERRSDGWHWALAALLFLSGAAFAQAADIGPSDDSWVSQQFPGTNYGGDWDIHVGYWNGIQRGYFKFNLTGIPDADTVYEAKVYLYLYGSGGPTVNYGMHKVYDDSWGEGSITWVNQPTTHGPTISINAIGGTSPAGWYSWDVTDDVEIEHLLGDDVLSLVLKLENEAPPPPNWPWAEFYAKENFTNQPYLAVIHGHRGFEPSGEALTGVWQGDAAWADTDGDGDLDLALHGNSSISQPGTNVTEVYGNFYLGFSYLHLSQSLDGLWSEGSNSMAWGDYDGDGDPDLAIAGETGTGPVTSVYKNDGSGTLSLDTAQNLPGLKNAALAWGDYDSDGDLDLALTGFTGLARIARIYENDYRHRLVWDQNQSLTGVTGGSVAWSDYDNDGDLDLVISGNSGSGPITELYKNSPTGTLTLDPGQNLAGTSLSCVAFGDYDNDGDVDLALTGSTGPGAQKSYLYRNTAGTYSLSDSLRHLYRSSLAWGDIDGDGKLDLGLMGYDGSALHSYVYYQARGFLSSFMEKDWGFTGLREGSLTFADYDGDIDLDLLITGATWSEPRADLYDNRGTINTTPSPPTTGFSASHTAGALTLTWGNGSDSETPPQGLYYNLRVGTSSGSDDVRSGVLTTPMLGNYLQTNSVVLSIPSDVYYWSVQTIDPGIERSAWSTEQVYTPPVTVQMVPDTSPIVIPQAGGSFGYTATVTNNTASQQTIRGWIEVTLPNGNPFGGNPVLGPLTLTLSAGQTFTKHMTQSVPGTAPAGTYVYEAAIGQPYPVQLDRDGFEFTKQ